MQVLVSRRTPSQRAADKLAAAGAQPEYTVAGTYVGGWQDDLRHGVGTATYANGDRYEGSWEHGVRSGRGVLYVTRRGRLVKSYEGQWVGNHRNGRGMACEANGDMCVGGGWGSARSSEGGGSAAANVALTCTVVGSASFGAREARCPPRMGSATPFFTTHTLLPTPPAMRAILRTTCGAALGCSPLPTATATRASFCAACATAAAC